MHWFEDIWYTIPITRMWESNHLMVEYIKYPFADLNNKLTHL